MATRGTQVATGSVRPALTGPVPGVTALVGGDPWWWAPPPAGAHPVR